MRWQWFGGSVPAFTPKSIAGLALWLDASDATTITQVANAVSQWRDKSGNNNHGNQATGTAQPLVQAAAQNGLNTLGFTSAASKALTLTTPIATLPGFTFAVVGQKPAGGGTNRLNPLSGDGSINYGLLHFSDNNFYSTSGVNNRLATNSPVALTAYASLIMANAGAVVGSTLLVNGIAQVLGLNGVGTGTNWTSIGGNGNTFFTDGSIAEIILYNSVLSAAQLTQLYTYLKTKWGTP